MRPPGARGHGGRPERSTGRAGPSPRRTGIARSPLLHEGEESPDGQPAAAEPLTPEHIKPRPLGHRGTSLGLNLVYTHLNRVIKARGLEALCVRPGHGGPSVLANSWLDGGYRDTYPDVTWDAQGLAQLFHQFSFPGGVPSHVAPEVPGSIHEGGGLGYALAHAHGAAFDLLSRLPEPELDALLRGYGHEPIHVGGDDPLQVHRALAAAFDEALDRVDLVQRTAPEEGVPQRPRRPVIVLRTPKGWTGPKEVDGEPVEGTWRAHQVPRAGVRENPAHLARAVGDVAEVVPARGLFDADGRPSADVLACVPSGTRRLGATP
ncbi:hypothetical protein [Streptomyces glomeratus]|uniref:hypothetical protein n=1 Tax=Streptomyces glomeratus TaxID=284452 RepID=UPI001F16CF03|nr:hypothetical protein [Streptomyces glomeratus]MCF1512616.1 hypothetical protein [Streptomyces glomeratus]